jgi:hypothetical protein
VKDSRFFFHPSACKAPSRVDADRTSHFIHGFELRAALLAQDFCNTGTFRFRPKRGLSEMSWYRLYVNFCLPIRRNKLWDRPSPNDAIIKNVPEKSAYFCEDSIRSSPRLNFFYLYLCYRGQRGKKWTPLYPPITYYWTGLLILDHSYLVGNLTSSKIAQRKVLELLKSWHFCIGNFRTW